MSLGARLRASSVLFFLSAIGPNGFAQSIEVTTERFSAPQTLPFAPAQGPAPVTAIPLAPTRTSFVLAQDKPIHTELQAWAKTQDWQLLWYPAVSWRVLREADLSNSLDVTAAVSEVIDILRDEGKPLRLKISDGNRVMEVFSIEVRND